MRFLLYLAVISSFIIAGCSAKANKPDASEEIELPVLQIDARDTLLQRSYVANINAFQNTELRAKVPGYLDRILVDEGTFVKKGQVLFALNDAEYKVQLSEASAVLASARAEVKMAQVEMTRVEGLVNKNIVTRSELDLAKAKLSAAEAKVQEAVAREEKAKIGLSQTMVRAPFSGIIDRIPLKVGSLITEGTLLTTLSDVHSVHVYFNVSENEYLQFVRSGGMKENAGQEIRLELSDGSDYPHSGKIETMEGEIDKETGSIAFRAGFPNPDNILKHGASGKIVLKSSVSGAILIPQRSVFEIQDKNYVFVLNKDNKVNMRSIEADTRLEDLIVVKSGLKNGDRIVYEGVQNVREGNTVKPRLLSFNTLLGIPPK
ncbi:efflux RND transporter periplasmic adaptor subunit [Terrimonas sp. NA20]|uniref:Efflux RND transporter periplasmic adaptor subunit n=1 Tax=Terrimonas ginsenosidimutans TaxID=2908004 RepID=A0ABS9KTT5_9BACT|nr:efflux RND transporter periplasmic adaptor subunit [Terrimonas ginsenosidimutans]MCG2615740.1 efflux RND transporter periplasmic adaptor subunit [Terrimonas ginsenosidimutans]